MTDAPWIDVGALADLRFNPGAPVRIGDRWLAIFRHGGRLFAIDNACPHASAPLCDGTVVDGRVACFLHCWQFDLATGACDIGPEWNVRAYPVREEGGRVLVDVSAPPA
jgi:NAD(P)H-dependent nitrite reductase small subunit